MGVSSYFPGNSVATAGWDRAITMKAAGTISRDPYFTEYWNTFLSVFGSFLASIFEKAGKSSICTGWTKKATRIAKLRAKL